MSREQTVIDLILYRRDSIRGGTPSSFSGKLYDLLLKADLINREKIRLAFPVEVEVFEEWYNSRCEDDFFQKIWIYLKDKYLSGLRIYEEILRNERFESNNK